LPRSTANNHNNDLRLFEFRLISVVCHGEYHIFVCFSAAKHIHIERPSCPVAVRPCPVPSCPCPCPILPAACPYPLTCCPCPCAILPCRSSIVIERSRPALSLRCPFPCSLQAVRFTVPVTALSCPVLSCPIESRLAPTCRYPVLCPRPSKNENLHPQRARAQLPPIWV